MTSGILLVNKPAGCTSFHIVSVLRRKLNVQKIGHAGTLDPFATGVLVLLIGKDYTRTSDQFLGQDKEYLAQLHLGVATDSYDCDGQVTATRDKIPSLDEIKAALSHFQGTISQIPPMFSAKKQNGKKLYELARQGKVVDRPAVQVTLETHFMSYEYPHLVLRVQCSKGTYIRSIAHDLGELLGCGAHLSALMRLRSGQFLLKDCMDGALLLAPESDYSHILPYLQK